ncbi:MAG: sodium:alanine symporter family protein [Prevotellaceae bacterium]|nr:sodium:alanine symporter family protein [Prevotella sp.]MDD7246860.1 sodium:alanine symporter family protein [Prevotellaceae bacterium]MDY2749510.1 sodium:alanine symporter family protein [Prevotella sp.]
MDAINHILDEISSVLWGYPMIILLVGTHLYLTIRLKFPQRKILTAIKLSVAKDKDGDGDVSQFGALATALAATIGTGNIIGVGTAIALGGPGAVFWCWITGVLGIATKYGEGLLAVKYRRVSEQGHMLGGPMYALEYGLKAKWAGVLFAIFTALAAFGIGSTVQANAITTLATDVMGVSPWASGVVITLLVALVVIGGIKSIAKVCTALVPVMAVLYVIGCIVILCVNSEYVWPAVRLICTAAFTPEAAGGGFVGSTILIAARFGIARGLFSNESGLGSAPIVAAAAKTKNPVRQALVSSSGTFWDTVIICAITGIVIVSSVLSYVDPKVADDGVLGTMFGELLETQAANIDGGMLTRMAFNKIPVIGAPLLMFGLFTFAFSTILGWSLYSARAVEYVFGYKGVKVWMWLFIVAVFAGSVISLNTVWTFADIFNALMAIPNLLALLLLSNVLVKDTNKYLWGGRLDEEEKPTMN